MMQSVNDAGVFYSLKPDATAYYVNGTWHQLASPPAGYAPYAGAEVVLADGRVLFVGGEYNQNQYQLPFAPSGLTNMSAVYDPVTDSWTMIAPPAGSRVHRRRTICGSARRKLCLSATNLGTRHVAPRSGQPDLDFGASHRQGGRFRGRRLDPAARWRPVHHRCGHPAACGTLRSGRCAMVQRWKHAGGADFAFGHAPVGSRMVRRRCRSSAESATVPGQRAPIFRRARSARHCCCRMARYSRQVPRASGAVAHTAIYTPGLRPQIRAASPWDRISPTATTPVTPAPPCCPPVMC